MALRDLRPKLFGILVASHIVFLVKRLFVEKTMPLAAMMQNSFNFMYFQFLKIVGNNFFLYLAEC